MFEDNNRCHICGRRLETDIEYVGAVNPEKACPCCGQEGPDLNAAYKEAAQKYIRFIEQGELNQFA